MTLNVATTHKERVTFDPKEMMGVLDLRSLGHYKIRQGVLQQNLSKCYHFTMTDVVCEQFNKFVNTLKKEKEKSKDEYSLARQKG